MVQPTGRPVRLRLPEIPDTIKLSIVAFIDGRQDRPETDYLPHQNWRRWLRQKGGSKFFFPSTIGAQHFSDKPRDWWALQNHLRRIKRSNFIKTPASKYKVRVRSVHANNITFKNIICFRRQNNFICIKYWRKFFSRLWSGDSIYLTCADYRKCRHAASFACIKCVALGFYGKLVGIQFQVSWLLIRSVPMSFISPNRLSN